MIIQASICLSLYFMFINWNEFIDSTTVTSINSTTSSLTDLYFPSVFICNINQVQLSMFSILNSTLVISLHLRPWLKAFKSVVKLRSFGLKEQASQKKKKKSLSFAWS
jgi:hypothetical protein